MKKKMWEKASLAGVPNAYRVSRAFEDLILNGWPEKEAPEESHESEQKEEMCTTD